MLSQEGLSVLQSIVISGAGMFVVVIELAVLAIAIRLFTRLLSLFNSDEIKDEKFNAASTQTVIKQQEHVVVLAVMSDCLNAAGGQYEITSIREVDT